MTGSKKYPGNSREAPELARLLGLTIIEAAGSAERKHTGKSELSRAGLAKVKEIEK